MTGGPGPELALLTFPWVKGAEAYSVKPFPTASLPEIVSVAQKARRERAGALLGWRRFLGRPGPGELLLPLWPRYRGLFAHYPGIHPDPGRGRGGSSSPPRWQSGASARRAPDLFGGEGAGARGAIPPTGMPLDPGAGPSNCWAEGTATVRGPPSSPWTRSLLAVEISPPGGGLPGGPRPLPHGWPGTMTERPPVLGGGACGGMEGVGPGLRSKKAGEPEGGAGTWGDRPGLQTKPPLVGILGTGPSFPGPPPLMDLTPRPIPGVGSSVRSDRGGGPAGGGIHRWWGSLY